MSAYTIIGIHGLNNKPPAATLATWWRASLVEGLTRNHGFTRPEIAFELVYWADVMHAKPYDADPQPYVAARGTGPLPRHTPSLKDTANDLKNTLDKLSTVLGTGDVLEAIKKRVAADLHGYNTDAKIRDELRRRLTIAIEAAHAKRQRICLLAHSMGSIVAFDVLSAMKPGPDTPRIDHFVTFGSPLGLHAVKAAARAQGFAMTVPENVQHWTNLADRRDPIALDARLETDYAANAAGVMVRDLYVRNGYVAPNGEANPHKVYGYLRTPEMGDVMLAFGENR